MTNEEVKEDSLLEKAVEQALEVPMPQESTVKPFLHQTVSLNKGLKKNVFRVGKKDQPKMEFKVDAEGKPVIHGNGGYIYIKDYSKLLK